MLLQADARALPLPDGYVQTVITSPPYWGLRDYGVEGQIGLEDSPQEYVDKLVMVFRELRRVLRDDGTVWLNIADSYFGDSPVRKAGGENFSKTRDPTQTRSRGGTRRSATSLDGLKAKDLCMIPARVALALQADGWYLRSDIIWAKGRSFDLDGAGSCMPESVRDRPTRGHEYVFLLTKNERYFYDFEAVKERSALGQTNSGYHKQRRRAQQHQDDRPAEANRITYPQGETPGLVDSGGGRNLRSVWVINPQPFKGAHFATFPEKLAETCLLAGSPPSCCPRCGAPHQRIIEKGPSHYEELGGKEAWRVREETALAQGTILAAGEGGQTRLESGAVPSLHAAARRTVGWRATCACDHGGESSIPVVLDPFCGSGTVGVVCKHHGRFFIGCDLKTEYLQMAQCRIEGTGC